MATKYLYLNDGRKVKYLGNQEPVLYSGPYRYIEAVEDTAPAATKTTKNNAAAVTQTTAAAENADAKAEKRRAEKINAINAQRSNELNLLNSNLNTQKQQAKQTSEDNMRQLYIAYMQGLRGIGQQAATWGAGGEIESLKNRSRLNYESNRAKENRSYTGVLNDIQAKYNEDLRQLEQKYLQQLLNI